MTNDDESTHITNRSGGVDLNAGSDVNVGGDVVGRDKITNIHYDAVPPMTGAQKFSDERRSAYARLWDMLEELHVKLRTEALGEEDFDQLVTNVNAFSLKNSLYLEKDHSALASLYLDEVFRLSQLVAQSRNKRLQRKWAKTDRLPPDVIEEYEEIQAAWAKVDKARDTLVNEFRRELEAT
jgi:hypothetical protein